MIAALVLGQPDGKFFPGRNLVPLLGRPMMVYPLLAAQNAESVDRVFLSTDAPSMARIAEHWKVQVVSRPKELRSASVPLEPIIEAGYGEICRLIDEELDALVVLLCNAPTVTAEMIDQGVDTLLTDSKWDAVTSVSLHNEFSPRNALRLGVNNRVEAISPDFPDTDEVFFPDALIWVLRSKTYFEGRQTSPKWLMQPRGFQVAPLIHEGYGDVDYIWQIPAVEDWLRRRGFSEETTPYEKSAGAVSSSVIKLRPRRAAQTSSRVLVTTVPFGEPDRTPLDLLEGAGIEYCINPLGRRLKEAELAAMAEPYTILIAGTEPITSQVMDAAPNLRLISRVGIGVDSVDLIAARERGIAVSYTPDAPSPAVAELAVGLMLNLLRHIAPADRGLRNGVWQRLMGRRIEDLTVGVIGVGRVGRRVVRILRGGFPGLKILANDLQPDLDFGLEHAVRWVDKRTLFTESDIVTLHVPLTPSTHRLVAAEALGWMKPAALLINTARGRIVDEHDLAAALRTGRLAGAGIDVFEQEPYSGELATLEQSLLTCHLGSMSVDCRTRMEIEATEEAVRFLRNEPQLRPVPDYEYELSGASSPPQARASVTR